jgi:hypothetical protein
MRIRPVPLASHSIYIPCVISFPELKQAYDSPNHNHGANQIADETQEVARGNARH